MENGVLEIIHPQTQLSMSLQQLYSLGSQQSFSLGASAHWMDQVIVYLQLHRQGFVLMRGEIFSQCHLNSAQDLNEKDLIAVQLFQTKCAFAVWKPNRKDGFKKSTAVGADLFIIVCSADDSPMLVEELAEVHRCVVQVLKCSDTANFVVAVVDQGNSVSWVSCSVAQDVPDITHLFEADWQ